MFVLRGQMPGRVDLTGQRFGRLVAVRSAGKNKHGQSLWECICDCGNVKVTTIGGLRSGDAKSCGCWASEKTSAKNWKHGACGTPEHRAWNGMRSRCYDPNTEYYHRYGGRGIKVCDRWLESFLNFLEDMGPRPSPLHTLDRVDNNRNYEPGNCRWATWEEQQNNRRTTRLLTHDGRTMSVAQWSRATGISESGIISRIQAGWSLSDALTTPTRDHSHPLTFNGRTMSLANWADELGLKRASLFARIYKYNWPIADALTTPPLPRAFRPRRP